MGRADEVSFVAVGGGAIASNTERLRTWRSDYGRYGGVAEQLRFDCVSIADGERERLVAVYLNISKIPQPTDGPRRSVTDAWRSWRITTDGNTFPGVSWRIAIRIEPYR